MSNKDSFITLIANELRKRNNPSDLKSSIIGKVVNLNPIIVSITDGYILLRENEELEISEWFRFRSNIDKESSLSSDVPTALQNAQNVTETHSYGGATCGMPRAIEYLASEIFIFSLV